MNYLKIGQDWVYDFDLCPEIFWNFAKNQSNYKLGAKMKNVFCIYQKRYFGKFELNDEISNHKITFSIFETRFLFLAKQKFKIWPIFCQNSGHRFKSKNQFRPSLKIFHFLTFCKKLFVNSLKNGGIICFIK